jgi:hypothetical protein
MTLLEDLDEMNLLVPDSPTLTADVLRAGRGFGQEAAALVMDAAGWQAEAAALLSRLESELGLLAPDANAAAEALEPGVATVLEALAAILEELGERRVELLSLESETEDAVRTAAKAAADAAAYVEAACENASTAAVQQYEEFEEQRAALETAMTVTEILPDLGAEARSASSAAQSSATTIVGQLTRLGPLAQGHLTDGEEAVQAQLAGLCDAVDAAMTSYGSSADAMGEELVEPLHALAPDVVTAAEAADSAAWNASEAIVAHVEQLARSGEGFAAEQQALEAKCDSLRPYVEEAYRAQERLEGGR